MLTDREWRCKRCRKLLGIWNGRMLEIKVGRGQEYHVASPARNSCRCGALNELAMQNEEQTRAVNG